MLNLYLSDEQIRNIGSRRDVANTAVDNAVRIIVEEIRTNLCGSVYVPKSGQHGYETSHVKLKDDFWEELKQLLTSLKERSKIIIMNAKETGLYANEYDYGDLNDYGGGNVNWWHGYIRDINSKVRDHYQEQMDIQAKITWKLAIKEVVEEVWGNRFDDDYGNFYYLLTDKWQAKLKEWGL